jgi:hypothetical protein
MMVVVAVMAGALHLIETLRANTVRCQMFLLRSAGAEQKMVTCEQGYETRSVWRRFFAHPYAE